MQKKLSEIWKEIIQEGSWLTVSNVLTCARIILVPFIVIGIRYHQWWPVFWMLVTAALTDMLDGHIARWRNEQTKLGACLDPIADKLLLTSSFTALAFVDSPSFFIPGWFVALVFVREFCILGGSLVLLLLNIPFSIKPSRAGKLTTFFQITFILWLFICHFAGWNPLKTYSIVLLLLAIFSVSSLGQYVMIGFDYVRNKIGL